MPQRAPPGGLANSMPDEIMRAPRSELPITIEGVSLRSGRVTILESVSLVLAPLAERSGGRLSGGEEKRCALAGASARDREILFLDEPTANLDPAATKAVEDIIVQVAAAGVKIVLATHDLGEARRLAGEVVFMLRGRVHESAPAKSFFAGPATQEAQAFLKGDLVI